jgi:hypothetical protein
MGLIMPLHIVKEPPGQIAKGTVTAIHAKYPMMILETG